MALGKGKTAGAATQQSGDSTQQLSHQVTPPAAPVSLANSFEQIEKLTDLTSGANAATATQAIARLDSILPAAQSDSDQVHIFLLQAESHFVLSDAATADADKTHETTAGCTILQDHEGKASRTRFKKRFDLYLHGDPAKGLPKTC